MTHEQRGPGEPGDRTEPDMGYGDLLQRYGDAMARVGQLQAQVEELTRQLQLGASPPPPSQIKTQPTPEPTWARQLLESVEALRSPAVQQSDASQTTTEQSAFGLSTGSGPQGEELRQLRVQVHSLASQLSQTEEQVREVQGHQAKRRRSQRHKPWWKKVTESVPFSRLLRP